MDTHTHTHTHTHSLTYTHKHYNFGHNQERGLFNYRIGKQWMTISEYKATPANFLYPPLVIQKLVEKERIQIWHLLIFQQDTQVYLKDTQMYLKDTHIYLKEIQIYLKDTQICLKADMETVSSSLAGLAEKSRKKAWIWNFT